MIEHERAKTIAFDMAFRAISLRGRSELTNMRITMTGLAIVIL
jgi:hypothetical protein